ncbi:hypothetical protein, partial [Candidatus Cyanaurora vandensis]|uniref:hypothetical protein n=1 Tax=Candidatus Cyanaurora vandensis TaxID=2714958 RepID=UPI00257E33F9
LWVTGNLRADQPRFNNRVLPALTTRFTLSGTETLTLEQASLGNLSAQGTVQLRPNGPTPVEALDLTWQARNYDLAALPVALPVSVGGNLTGAGQVTGNLDTLAVTGRVSLSGGRVGRYSFAPLQGPVRYQNQRFTTTLAGGGDQLRAQGQVLATGVRLTSFKANVASTQVVAEGVYDYQRGLTQLTAQAQNLDLAKLGLAPVGPIRTLGGVANGQLALRQNGRSLVGDIQAEVQNGRVNNLRLATTQLRARVENNQVTLAPSPSPSAAGPTPWRDDWG